MAPPLEGVCDLMQSEALLQLGETILWDRWDASSRNFKIVGTKCISVSPYCNWMSFFVGDLGTGDLGLGVRGKQN